MIITGTSVQRGKVLFKYIMEDLMFATCTRCFIGFHNDKLCVVKQQSSHIDEIHTITDLF